MGSKGIRRRLSLPTHTSPLYCEHGCLRFTIGVYIVHRDRLNPIFHRVACLIDGNPHFQLGSIVSTLHFSLHALGVSDDKLHECVFVVFSNSRKRILSSNI